METNKKWIGVTAILLIGLLGVIGYQITNQTYFCSERGIVMECARFSSSGNRCYPNLFDNKGYRDCSNWIKVEKEIEIKITSNDKITTNKQVKRYLCNQKECKLIS